MAASAAVTRVRRGSGALHLLRGAAPLAPFAARIAVALFATNGLLLEWARVARSYSLALLLATAATWAYLRAVDRGGWRRWSAWVVLATLGVYAHLFTVLVLAAQVVALPLFTTEPRRRREGAFATVTVGVLMLPLAGLALTAGDGQIWWIDDLHPRQLLWFATAFSGTSTSLLAIPAAVLFLTGAVTLVRRLPGLRPEAMPQVSAAFVLAWFTLSIGVVVLVSLVRPLLVPRYFIVLLPAYAMIVAVGIGRLRARPWLVALALVSVMATSLPLLVARYDPAGHEDWRGASAVIAAGWQPGDVIVIDPDINLIPLEHYLAQWVADRQPVPVQGLQPGAFDTGYTGRPQVIDFERSLEVPQAERAWLVVREPSEAITAVRPPDGVVPPPGMQDWRLRGTWVSEKTSVALLEAPDGGGS